MELSDFLFPRRKKKLRIYVRHQVKKSFSEEFFFISENVFWGRNKKKLFFFPWKNIFVLIKVKRFSLENFFFTLWNQLNKCFFQENYLFFVFKSEQKKSLGQKKRKIVYNIFFQDFIMLKTEFFSSALHFVLIKSSWKKIFHLISQKNKQTKGVWKDPQKFWSHKHRRK